MDKRDINYVIQYLKKFHPHVEISEEIINLARTLSDYKEWLQRKKNSCNRAVSASELSNYTFTTTHSHGYTVRAVERPRITTYTPTDVVEYIPF